MPFLFLYYYQRIATKIEPKNDRIPLPLDTVFALISEMNLRTYSVPLDDKVAHTCFTREFISDVYGGSPQGMSPNVKFKIDHPLHRKYKYLHFVFARLDWNPLAPRLPGRAGLVFELRLKQRDDTKKDSSEDDEGEEVSTFVRLASGEWVYIGKCRWIRGREMTCEEYNMLSPLVCQSYSVAKFHKLMILSTDSKDLG